jgi:hypothetical protein
VAQFYSRMIAIALLGAMIAAGAGTMCLLPAMAQYAASSVPATTGCHSPHAPSHPQSADYRCCVGGHSSALLTKIFTPQPALRSLDSNAPDVLVAANDVAAPANASGSSDSLPGILILRI